MNYSCAYSGQSSETPGMVKPWTPEKAVLHALCGQGRSHYGMGANKSVFTLSKTGAFWSRLCSPEFSKNTKASTEPILTRLPQANHV